MRELQRALQAVVGQHGAAEDGGQFAGGVAAQQVHLPEAVLRGDEALGEDEVVQRTGVDVGNAVGIALDRHRRSQAVDGQRAVELRQVFAHLACRCGNARRKAACEPATTSSRTRIAASGPTACGRPERMRPLRRASSSQRSGHLVADGSCGFGGGEVGAAVVRICSGSWLMASLMQWVGVAASRPSSHSGCGAG